MSKKEILMISKSEIVLLIFLVIASIGIMRICFLWGKKRAIEKILFPGDIKQAAVEIVENSKPGDVCSCGYVFVEEKPGELFSNCHAHFK